MPFVIIFDKYGIVICMCVALFTSRVVSLLVQCPWMEEMLCVELRGIGLSEGVICGLS